MLNNIINIFVVLVKSNNSDLLVAVAQVAAAIAAAAIMIVCPIMLGAINVYLPKAMEKLIAHTKPKIF